MTLELADVYTLKREPIACVARRGQSSEALDLTLNGGEIVLNLNDHRHVGRLSRSHQRAKQPFSTDRSWLLGWRVQLDIQDADSPA